MTSGKRVFLHIILPLFCCLLCAVFTWAYVMAVTDPVMEKRFDAEDVKPIYGNETVFVEAGCKLQRIEYGDITVKAKRSEIVSCLQNGVSVQIDCALLFGETPIAPGEYTFTDVAVTKLPALMGEVESLYVLDSVTVTLVAQ